MNGNIQVNYELNTSNSNNYNILETSSSSESFPKLVGNGIFVEYKQISFSSDFINNLDWPRQDKQQARTKSFI